MKYWARLHFAGSDLILAICDENLLGKRFEEGEFVLEINNFWKGELVGEEKAKELAKKATIINAVGENAVKLVFELGLAEKGMEKKVKGIPHVQIALL